ARARLGGSARRVLRPDVVVLPSDPVRQARHGPLRPRHGHSGPPNPNGRRPSGDGRGRIGARRDRRRLGGPMTALFAATHPERTAAAVLYGTYPSTLRHDDYPWGVTREEIERAIEERTRRWNEPDYLEELLAKGFRTELCR